MFFNLISLIDFKKKIKNYCKILVLVYSETLELLWNIEPNRIQSNRIELKRTESNLFSIFRCFFEFGSIEPNP
jgi:hypothetical protein